VPQLFIVIVHLPRRGLFVVDLSRLSHAFGIQSFEAGIQCYHLSYRNSTIGHDLLLPWADRSVPNEVSRLGFAISSPTESLS
jgi:hypothetical protein